MELESKLRNLLAPEVAELGYEIAKLNLVSNKNGLTLEIAVDRDDLISLDDIVLVSGRINEVLDREDPISAPYTLDVSSLGAEKPIPIDRLAHYVGRYVNVHIRDAVGGKNDYEGDLLAIENDVVRIAYRDKTRTKTVELALPNIDKARLAIKF